MTGRLLLLVCALSLLPGPVAAQIVQPVNRFAAPGEPQSKVAEALAQDPSAPGANVVSQADVSMSADGSTKVGLEAVDLWVNPWIRVYGRLTLPVSSSTTSATQSAATQSGTGNSSTATGNSSTTTSGSGSAAATLSDTVKQQLVDPYGGLFNLSAGVFYRFTAMGSRTDETPAKSHAPHYARLVDQGPLALKQKPPLQQPPLQQPPLQEDKKSAVPSPKKADPSPEAIDTAKEVQDSHGVFLDVRGGLKALQLPGPADGAPTISGNKVTYFWSFIAGAKIIVPLYSAQPVGTAADLKNWRTGGLTFGSYFVFNKAADITQSSAFDTLLNRQVTAWTNVVAWTLPNTSIASLTLSATPYISDSRIGHTVFVFGITLAKNDPAPTTKSDSATTTTSPSGQ